MLVGNVTALQGIVLGDDVDYMGSKRWLWDLSEGRTVPHIEQGW